MIEVKNLTKSYLHHKTGRHFVFKDLSFVIPSNCNVAIIGRNGEGKSTLVNILSGVDAPDSGKIITDKSISWPVGLRGGFQGSLTGRQNAQFVARVQGFSGKELREKVRFVEEFAEIGKYFDLPAGTYSAGMRSRVSFGISLAFDFDYYLVDEAMSVGDAHFKRKASAIFKQKVDKANIILVTHSMSQVKEMCDLVLILEKGKVKPFEDTAAGIEYYNNL